MWISWSRTARSSVAEYKRTGRTTRPTVTDPVHTALGGELLPIPPPSDS
ncbi:hypothetical protein T261_02351 [Streptomyces lydicus]|nr:hypothetical protein T261_02351 [Streptomyces lydicus]